jgi:TolB-like protein
MTDYLNPEERAKLEELRAADCFVEQVLRQLYRILASQKFARVQQNAKDFLGFIVAKQLLGLAEQIKETTIAVAVYGEPADFNPAESAKVRVAAGDLRQRVADYYVREGHDDPIEIVIPLDTYAPDIRDRRASVAVSLFENWHPTNDQHHLCASLSDEITYRLNQVSWIRARRVDVLASGAGPAIYGVRGSLEIRGDSLRMNVSLGHLLNGRIVFSRSFQGRRDAIFKTTREIADALSEALRADIREPSIASPKSSRRAS